MKIPASPQTRGSQYGMPKILGDAYFHAPKTIAVISARAPKTPQRMKRNKSSLLLQTESIKILVTAKISVKSTGLVQSSETENNEISANRQLCRNALTRRFISMICGGAAYKPDYNYWGLSGHGFQISTDMLNFAGRNKFHKRYGVSLLQTLLEYCGA